MCLHTINCQDGFNNVAAPKLAVDRNYLLVSRTDTIHIYDSTNVFQHSSFGFEV